MTISESIAWIAGWISFLAFALAAWIKWLNKKYEVKDRDRLKAENEELKNRIHEMTRRM